MVIGPLLGGFITDRASEQMAAATAAFCSLLSIVIILLFIPANAKCLKEDSSSSNSDDSAEKKGSLWDSIYMLPCDFDTIFRKPFKCHCTVDMVHVEDAT